MKIHNALSALMQRDVIFLYLLRAVRERYGVTQLGDLTHFTAALRADIETALGAALRQTTGIEPYTTLIHLVLPPGVSKEVDAAIHAFETANPSV